MKKMSKTLTEYIRDFNVVKNALDMRDLIRWNGRTLRTHENLAEHTHLVCACAMQIVDDLEILKPILLDDIDYRQLMRYCLLHDAEELFRGDILSVTKDAIPGLRASIDKEEDEFLQVILGQTNHLTKSIVRLSDLMACYKFLERELEFPSNDFAIGVYKETKQVFDDAWKEFCTVYDVPQKSEPDYPLYAFAKGYADDAGTDIVLLEDVFFMPHMTTTIGLKVRSTPDKNEMGLLFSRTSAATRGIIVASCPIDPNYSGEITAIVHNISNDIIHYCKGESFCQIVKIPFNQIDCEANDVFIKKQGERTDGKMGSTDIKSKD